ncbi:hypothetical protein K8Q94_02555 [Candidatus Nomurabacteria bacterium]|nr:hypothetical protein [Candidatus Nomurabacteria bacterium]
MDQNFQTSFIPKKPMIEERSASSRPIGIFTVLSLFVFFIIILASAGLYFYKGMLQTNITKMQNDLILAKNRFEPQKINQLQILDKRLNASKEILANHVSISPIFEILSQSTLKNVRYTKFSYSAGDDKKSKISVKMSGQALGYRSIALQSDLFSKNKMIIDPVFSNLSLDDKGNVLFDLDFSVDPTLLNYKQMIKNTTQN